MANINKTEVRVLIKIFKDFQADYNANSLSKTIGMTPRGTLNTLKSLEKKKILIGKKHGKAVFYKVNFKEDYSLKILEAILIDEAREKAERWIDEFKEVFSSADIVLIFGSILKNQKQASDIDVLLVYEKSKYRKIKLFLDEKNKILFKKIHDIPQTREDIEKNLKAGNKALVNAVKEGYVLHGQDKFIEVIKNVTSF